jgi:DNA-binding transcriptional MerR regulator
MTKSADAFRTISEVAEELDLQKHVLRFWEVKFPQIKPMKRGGGRRYYRPADLELLRGIRHLLHSDGYTIKGVQRIIREKGIDAVKRAAAEEAAGAAPASPLLKAGAPDEGVRAIAGSLKERSSSRRSRAAGGLGKDQQRVIVAAIEELQACRDELTDGEARTDAPIAVAQSRTGRSVG